jgi:pyruvate/2-oxoglutarate dehydrogenase complex dihydrolipoamide acyltransferase (E2) component
VALRVSHADDVDARPQTRQQEAAHASIDPTNPQASQASRQEAGRGRGDPLTGSPVARSLLADRVRHLAAELDVELGTLEGSGQGGAITG